MGFWRRARRTISHQSFTEIPQRRPNKNTHHEIHSAPGLSSITTLISQLQTNCPGRREGGEKEWETMKKYEKQSEESNRSTEIGVFRAEGKQRGCFLTAGDMARLQRHSSKKNTWKWQQLLYDSLNHGAAGSADIPICLLCHWSKLAFMSLPSMQFTAALNKASSVYNPMLFP